MSDTTRRTTCPEIEELAALLDGKLSGEARAAMLAHLDACPTCYEVFVESSRFQAEAEAENSGEVIDFQPARMTRARSFEPAWLAWGAAAAALFAAVVLWTPARDVLTGRGVLTAALPVDRLGRHLEPGGQPFDSASWSYARGGEGFALGLPENERSFRLGVRLVDLEMALRAGDSAAARALLPEVTDLAGSFELAEHLEFSYESLAARLDAGDPPADLLELSGQTARFAADVAQPEFFLLGKWTEAGRLAAAAGQARFFRQRSMRTLPEGWTGLDLPPDAAATLARLRGSLETGVNTADLADLARDFAILTTQAGNR